MSILCRLFHRWLSATLLVRRLLFGVLSRILLLVRVMWSGLHRKYSIINQYVVYLMDIQVNVVVMVLMVMVLVIDILLPLIDIWCIILLVLPLLLPVMSLRCTRPGVLLTFERLILPDLRRAVWLLHFLWRSRLFFGGWRISVIGAGPLLVHSVGNVSWGRLASVLFATE